MCSERSEVRGSPALRAPTGRGADGDENSCGWVIWMSPRLPTLFDLDVRVHLRCPCGKSSDGQGAERESKDLGCRRWRGRRIFRGPAGAGRERRNLPRPAQAIAAVPDGAAVARSILQACSGIAAAWGHEPSAAFSEQALGTITQAGSSLTSSMYRDMHAGGKGKSTPPCSRRLPSGFASMPPHARRTDVIHGVRRCYAGYGDIVIPSQRSERRQT